MFSAMNMNVVATILVTAADPVPASSASATTGFAQALGSVQSGAPPGAGPPSTAAKVGEEVAKLGPIAQSPTPDFQPQIDPAAPVPVDPRGDSKASSKKSPGVPVAPAFIAGTSLLPVPNVPTSVAAEQGSAASTHPGGAWPTLTTRSIELSRAVTVANVQTAIATVEARLSSIPGSDIATEQPLSVQQGSTPVNRQPENDSIRSVATPPTQASVKYGPIPDAAATPLPLVETATGQEIAETSNDATLTLPETALMSPAVGRIGERLVGSSQTVQQIAESANQSRTARLNTAAPANDQTLFDATSTTAVIDARLSDTKVASEPPYVSESAALEVAIAVPIKPIGTQKVAASEKSDSDSNVPDEAAPDAISSAIGTNGKEVPVIPKSDSLDTDEATPATAKLSNLNGQAQMLTGTGSSAPVNETSGTAGSLKPTDLNLVVKQIADRIELLAATQPKNGVTILLQPDSLGSISLTVKSMSGSVQAHITASNETVRAALEQNRPLLGQAMSERGFKLEAVSIGAQTQSSTSAQRQSAQQQQAQAEKSPNRPAPLGAALPDPTTTRQARMTVRSVDGVDLWI